MLYYGFTVHKSTRLIIEKMGFPNNGENHYSGIKNEKMIVHYMNSHPDNNFAKKNREQCGCRIKPGSWKHEGGTKQTKDASFELENGERHGISIKNHKTGTFDYKNTTKLVPTQVKQTCVSLKDNSAFRNLSLQEQKEKVNKCCSDGLDRMTSNDIVLLLDFVFQSEPDTDWISIHCEKTKTFVSTPISNITKRYKLREGESFKLRSGHGAITSRQIFRIHADGTESNTHLRIRLLLNNGIKALCEKNSVPCLKIQQDHVDTLIETIREADGTAIDTYA